VIKGLAANNVFLVSTGCVAGTAAKLGLMNAEAVEKYAGEGLKAFINMLNEANAGKLTEKLPLVFHMGSCVDNSRAYDLNTLMAKEWGIDTPKVPYAASAPEAMSREGRGHRHLVRHPGHAHPRGRYPRDYRQRPR